MADPAEERLAEAVNQDSASQEARTGPDDEPQKRDYVEIRRPNGSKKEGAVARKDGDVCTVVTTDGEKVLAKCSDVRILRRPQ